MRANMATRCVVRGCPESPLLIGAPIQVSSCSRLQNQEHRVCWTTTNELANIKGALFFSKLWLSCLTWTKNAFGHLLTLALCTQRGFKVYNTQN